MAIAITNGLDIGVLLVNSALHIRLASKTGMEMLRATDGLAIQRGCLACADRAAHRRLRQLVAMAADPDGPVGSVAVPRPSGARPYLLTVMPLHDERAWLGTPRARALVLAIDAARCRPASAAHLCERYRLTAAEARTALALLDAERLRDVAERLGRQPADRAHHPAAGLQQDRHPPPAGAGLAPPGARRGGGMMPQPEVTPLT